MIKRLLPQEALNFRELPIKIFEKILNNDYLCYGEINENMTISIALFTISGVRQGQAILKYIAVDSDYRLKGHSANLLKYSVEELKKNNIDYIYLRLTEDRVSLYLHHNYLMSLKFYPLSVNGHRLNYKLSQVEDTILYKQVIPKLASFPKTEALVNWEGKEVEKFIKANENRGLYISKSFHNVKYSRIYKQGGDIKGVILIGLVGNTYLVSQLYHEAGVSRELVIPALIGASINNILKDSKNGSIAFNVYDKGYYQGILGIMGKPHNDYMIGEYYLQI